MFKVMDKKMITIYAENFRFTGPIVYNPSLQQTCLKQPLKYRQNKDLNGNGSLMKVESLAECSMLPLEHSAILLTCIKQ